MPLVDSLDCRRVEDAERGVRREDWREAMAEAEKGSARSEPVQDSSELEVVRLVIGIGGVSIESDRQSSIERKNAAHPTRVNSSRPS